MKNYGVTALFIRLLGSLASDIFHSLHDPFTFDALEQGADAPARLCQIHRIRIGANDVFQFCAEFIPEALVILTDEQLVDNQNGAFVERINASGLLDQSDQTGLLILEDRFPINCPTRGQGPTTFFSFRHLHLCCHAGIKIKGG